jgi:hypothetical protein
LVKFGELAAASGVWLLRNCRRISIAAVAAFDGSKVRERIVESKADRSAFATIANKSGSAFTSPAS